MAVTLQYIAERPTPLDRDEESAVARIVERANAGLRADAPRLAPDADLPEAVVLRGRTELPVHPLHALTTLAHWCGTLTELRRAVPDAWWSVRVDGEQVPWDDATGYALPGMDDPELLAALR